MSPSPRSTPRPSAHVDLRPAAFASRTWALLSVLIAAFTLALPAHALRIVNYNITNFPSSNGTAREPHFRTILGPLEADIVVVQEMEDQTGVNRFLNNVLNVIEPGEWAAALFIQGNDTNNALFYKPASVQVLGRWVFYPNPAIELRLVNCYRIRPIAYQSTEFRIYSIHLKASTGFETQRLDEAIGIRDSMNVVPPQTHSVLMGDFNIYTGAEPAFLKFKESQVDNDGRLYDPLNAPASDWGVPGLARFHSQSPCTSPSCPPGFAGGGLDDRFDMFLPTYPMNDGEGIELLVDTYKIIGNDSLHYNKNITDAPTIREGAAYATALRSASDHLPIRVDLQLPARIDVTGFIDFGRVIGAVTTPFAVANGAVAPGDELNYSFDAAPAGFTAPGGSFIVQVGAPANVHTLGVAAGPPGFRFGNQLITSDDPDFPSRQVTLIAEVLDHAAPSLDSLALQSSATIDFGSQTSNFPPQTVAVHNFAWDESHAGLSILNGIITGGDGRFSIVGGFTPALVTDTGKRYTIVFDDDGATPDQPYDATLTFSNADEPIPGGQALPNLVLNLTATVTTGQLPVPGASIPEHTRLYTPFPNPLERSTTVRFDLARASEARLEVFDLSGRRMAVIAERAFEPGRYAFRWEGRDQDGATAKPGLYFVRLVGSGVDPETVRLVIAR